MKTFKIITELAEFKELQTQWQQLLEETDANQLFLSWFWQYSWWEVWGEKLCLELEVYCVFENGQLVGLLPLYREYTKPRFSVGRARLQFIGNHWQKTPTVRTEYLGPIVKNNKVLEALVERLNYRSTWDEIIICDAFSTQGSSIELFIHCLTNKYRCTCISLESSTGYRVPTNNSVEQFLRRLGRNTRKKYFNDINKAQLAGIVNKSLVEKPNYFLDLLNSFHIVRWGTKAFNTDAKSFHMSLISRLLLFGEKVHLNALSFEDETIAVSYSIEMGGEIFNLQLGFIEKYEGNLSLGKIRLGLDILAAFSENGTLAVDLLAGTGKNTDYKKHLGGQIVNFSTVALVNKRRISVNYKTLSLLKKLKNIFKRMRPVNFT